MNSTSNSKQKFDETVVVETTCGTCPEEETPAVDGGWATAQRNSGQ
jgi:hypothetical protein